MVSAKLHASTLHPAEIGLIIGCFEASVNNKRDERLPAVFAPQTYLCLLRVQK